MSIFGRKRLTAPPRAWFKDTVKGDYYRTAELVTLELNQVRTWPSDAPGKLGLQEDLITERARIEKEGGVIRTPALAWGNKKAGELY
jgi:hypothetical protein